MRAFIIHGWYGSPKGDWIPWLTEQLKSKGYEVTAPGMPNTDNPKINPWVNKLKEAVGKLEKDDVLIGHSIGCQTILRFLETLQSDEKVNKVIFVAPWMKLANLLGDEEWKIAKPWLETPIKLNKVKTKAKSFIALFSDNDPWVPLKENVKVFREKLNPKIAILKNKGHFSEDEGVKELPEILDYF